MKYHRVCIDCIEKIGIELEETKLRPPPGKCFWTRNKTALPSHKLYAVSDFELGQMIIAVDNDNSLIKQLHRSVRLERTICP